MPHLPLSSPPDSLSPPGVSRLHRAPRLERAAQPAFSAPSTCRLGRAPRRDLPSPPPRRGRDLRPEGSVAVRGLGLTVLFGLQLPGRSVGPVEEEPRGRGGSSPQVLRQGKLSVPTAPRAGGPRPCVAEWLTVASPVCALGPSPWCRFPVGARESPEVTIISQCVHCPRAMASVAVSARQEHGEE